MPRYAAEGLDLSRLPPPQAVRALDYETLLAERRARLINAFDAAGITYDAARFDTDPAMILQQVDAYRELLALAATNAAVRATMAAFAEGGDLDHIAARYGIQRMTGELDDRLRWRVLLAPESWGVGKLAGYLQAALTAHIDVIDAGVWVDRTIPAEPVVRIAPMVAAGNGLPSSDVLDAVRMFLNRPDAKAATDVVAVQPPRLIEYAIQLVVEHRRGPDPVVLTDDAEAACVKLAAERHSPGRDVPLSAIDAAGQVSAAERVRILSPLADVVAGKGDLTFCTLITVDPMLVDG